MRRGKQNIEIATTNKAYENKQCVLDSDTYC